MDKITPVFLFSLPRSGSTLLQRMIAAHPDVATSSEPWVLLPCIDLLQHRNNTFSTYGHAMAVQAVHDFAKQMDGESLALQEEVKEMVLRLYRRASPNGESCFLDKTPRYHTISEPIIEMFPEAKFILLVRHPLAVVASILETWADKKWYLYGYKTDLYDGYAGLELARQRFGKQLLLIRYEDLLVNPDESMAKVFAHLDLEADSDVWEKFVDVHLSGRMKDPTGIGRYQSLSSEPLDKWKSIFYNRYRIAWAHRYLNWLGKERLATFGYDIEEIKAELDVLPKSWKGVFGDVLRSAYGSWRIFRQGDVAELFETLAPDQRNILR